MIQFYDVAIGDEGLRHLEGLKSLRYVGLHNSGTTEEGRARLQLAIPGALIELSHNPIERREVRFGD